LSSQRRVSWKFLARKKMISTTKTPVRNPTFRPTRPSRAPTFRPTVEPSIAPSPNPSSEPSQNPSSFPSSWPSHAPFSRPTIKSTYQPIVVMHEKPPNPLTSLQAQLIYVGIVLGFLFSIGLIIYYRHVRYKNKKIHFEIVYTNEYIKS
jgi:hypothetical protein